MSDSSPTYLHMLSAVSEGFLKEKGSKFHAFAYPVEAIEEVDELVQQVRKRFYDARHHCTAYRIGVRGEQVYSNDDGEPGNSAGPPILAAIRSAELTNVLIVVVRYFGGTKLGIRGLIEAYRGAAEDAIAAGKIFTLIPKVSFSISYPYSRTSDVNRILHRFDTEQLEARFTDTCYINLSIAEENFKKLQEQFELARIDLKIESAPTV